MEIITERLLLRTLTEADAAIVKAFGGDEFKDELRALEWIRWVNSADGKYQPRQMFYVWLQQANQLIGRVYFHSKPELSGEVEIGYGISEPYRNKGYATEAAKAVICFAFEQAGQAALCAIVKPENAASRRVVEKLGFAHHGLRTVFDDGANREFDYYRLQRDSMSG